jgi:hypothetical protein
VEPIRGRLRRDGLAASAACGGEDAHQGRRELLSGKKGGGRGREKKKNACNDGGGSFFFFSFSFFPFLFSLSFSLLPFLPPKPTNQNQNQIAKLPLSRSACAPGSLVAARLVLRLPAANGTKFTAGLLPRVNELADSKTVRRCVLGGGVNGLSTPQEAARAAGSAVAFASGGCTECNTLSAGGPSSVSSSSSNGGYGGSESSSSSKDSDEGVKLCPSTPGVWYVDTLPLKVPTAAAGWCDDGDDEDEAAGAKKKTTATTAKAEKVRRPEQDAFAAFVVNAGSKVDVASFEIIPRGAAGGAVAQSA